jgi:dTDP-4-dehydrorhamnose 3,5-epimerase
VIFVRTDLDGAWIVDVERLEDERGFFARAWCREEFAQHGVDVDLVQCSISFNRRRGTLRGMHYQARPFAEVKLVRCTRGGIYDVVVDLRPGSPTFRRWVSAELTEDNRRSVLVPAGCAHGFQTLSANTEVFYQMSRVHAPEHARGVRWDDPAFAIAWPIKDDLVISERDRAYPDFAS